MKLVVIGLIFFFLSNCTLEKENKTRPIKNRTASLSQISQFFNSKGDIKVKNIEFFDNDTTFPIKSISIGSYELGRSVLFEQNDFSVLILDNPTNTAVDMFIKRGGQLVYEMYEDKHYPDSIHINRLNDTLLVCEYYWKYDFGSDLSDIRTYYFIGNQYGVFKYRYNSANNKGNLNFDSPTFEDGFLYLKTNDLTKMNKLKIATDTLIKLGAGKESHSRELNSIPYKSFSFTKH